MSLIISLPFSSSDPILSKATFGVSKGYNDLYKAPEEFSESRVDALKCDGL